MDVVGAALIVGDFLNAEANEAANFVVGSLRSGKSLAREIAEIYMNARHPPQGVDDASTINLFQHRAEVARLKTCARHYPRNAILWADMAFHYTLLGQRERAMRSMDIAVTLGGNNRFILRSAARCFLHLGDADKALFQLRRSPLSRADPWLVSAEIAISEGIGHRTNLAKLGQMMVIDQSFSPWAVNELAATLSTLETRHGSVRKAKKLLAMALQRPNEITVAQAEWLAVGLGQEVARSQVNIVAAYEADARRDFRDANYEIALQHARKWFTVVP